MVDLNISEAWFALQQAEAQTAAFTNIMEAAYDNHMRTWEIMKFCNKFIYMQHQRNAPFMFICGYHYLPTYIPSQIAIHEQLISCTSMNYWLRTNIGLHIWPQNYDEIQKTYLRHAPFTLIQKKLGPLPLKQLCKVFLLTLGKYLVNNQNAPSYLKENDDIMHHVGRAYAAKERPWQSLNEYHSSDNSNSLPDETMSQRS
jgi:hypothetical protein